MGVIQYNTRSKNIGPFTEELNSLITNCNLDYDATKNLILINEHNGDEIEKVIEADKDYIPFAKYIFNYLVKSYQTQMDKDKLIAIIREIDRDNSTNIWRYKKSREKIFKAVNFIVEPKHNFYERLKVGDKTLPDQINAYVGSGMPSPVVGPLPSVKPAESSRTAHPSRERTPVSRGISPFAQSSVRAVPRRLPSGESE